MGSWDCYCAICGGPFGGGEISPKPRTLRFHRRFPQGPGGPEGNEHEDQNGDDAEKEVDEEDQKDEADDNESLESYDEEHSYDPDIISESDTEWSNTLHILGFNPEAPGVSKAFVSGPGEYSDFGGVDVEAGDDPNYKEEDSFTCYRDFDNQDTNIVFPFHWCCYELLSKALTGTSNVAKIDKDLLYSVMQELSTDQSSRLNLDYGNPGPAEEQFWESNPGEEFLVSHPTTESDIVNHLVTLIAGGDFNVSPSNLDLGRRVKHDPFAKLPYDLVYKLSCLLPVKALLDFGKVSWPIQSAFQGNGNFWKERIKRAMPWFFELHELMNHSDSEVFEGISSKSLLAWADNITTPKIGMKGPSMGIANRRRIWSVCEQLADRYLSRCVEEVSPNLDHIERMIRKLSGCVQMPVVYSPMPPRKDKAVAYWVRSWADVYSDRNILEIFWDAEGSLVGVSLSVDGHRRLFGKDDAIEGGSRQALVLEKGDWITGLILHLPVLCLHAMRRHVENRTPDNLTTTSIKGITILRRSGIEAHFGETDKGHSRRPLLVSEGMTVVGIMGQTGPENQIVRIGLLQTERPDLDDYSFARKNSRVDIPQLPTLQSWLWKDDYIEILTNPVWNHPTLRLVQNLSTQPGNSGHLSHDVHDDLVPHQTLIWAKDRQELRSLKRLTGYIVVGGNVSGWDDGEAFKRPVHDLCGIKAKFSPEYNAGQRIIGIQKEKDGSEWAEDHCSHFVIDGMGGEFVDEISFAMHESPKAIKLRTNFGREVYWGEEKVKNWKTLHAPEGETIVGIVMTFGIPSGFSWETKSHAHSKLSSVAALTLPI